MKKTKDRGTKLEEAEGGKMKSTVKQQELKQTQTVVKTHRDEHLTFPSQKKQLLENSSNNATQAFWGKKGSRGHTADSRSDPFLPLCQLSVSHEFIYQTHSYI